jgi:hypothetical protein
MKGSREKKRGITAKRQSSDNPTENSKDGLARGWKGNGQQPKLKVHRRP